MCANRINRVALCWMEVWKDGRIEGWKNGRMEEWKNGMARMGFHTMVMVVRNGNEVHNGNGSAQW